MFELARSSNYRGSSCRKGDGGDVLFEGLHLFDASHVTGYVTELNHQDFVFGCNLPITKCNNGCFKRRHGITKCASLLQRVTVQDC